jgi:Mce-associated membrane protein
VAVPPAPDGRSGVKDDSSASSDIAEHPFVEGSGASATPESTPASSTRFRLALLVAFVALLLVATAAVAYLAATRAVPAVGIGGEQAEIQAQREDVMSRAGQFMLRVNTYGPDLLEADGTMPEYRKLVEELISPKFAEDFTKGVPAAEQTVAEAGVGRTARLFSTAVSAIDSDSATALVAGSFTNSYPKKPGSEERIDLEPLPFRVSVKMVKIDGEWLVDDFTPLTGEAAEPAAPGSDGEGTQP